MDKEYLKKAEKLTQYFNMYCYGNYDLTLDEIAIILKLIAENRLDELKGVYDRIIARENPPLIR